VTGTNGKTTVTTLAAHLLNQCGVPAVALGNVGLPFSEITTLPSDTVVVGEFSSYQLESLQTACLDAAVIMNITPDHLDRYSSFDAYSAAKMQITNALRPKGELAVSAELLDRYSFPEGTIPFGSGCPLRTEEGAVWLEKQRICSLPEELKGFAVTNYLAAVWLCHRFVEDTSSLGNLGSYKKPPHRLQNVGLWNGLQVIDDGKATNVASVLGAVEAVSGPIYLLAGGRHKGESYAPWCAAFAGKVHHVYAFGEAASLIRSDLDGSVPTTQYATMDAALAAIETDVYEEGTLLFSPGCSSFDAYSNYVARSLHFQQLLDGCLK
jgi:UDP-N-acetylmuramoylalanine--D-glutamate ligase